MYKNIITVLFISISILCFSQEGGKIAHIVKGKIIDATTNEAVSYTNIGLENTYYGTASDANGNFELKIPNELVSKNIFFSAVGFKSKKFAVETLFNKDFIVIKLESQSYGINDIDIAAKSKVLLRILRMANENIPHNYIVGPLNMICKYENYSNLADTTILNKKANVVIYDKNGYKKTSKQDAFQSVKYSVKKEDEDYRFSDGGLNIDELLQLDWVRSASSLLNPDLLAGFNLKLANETIVDGKDCWIISYHMENPTVEYSGDYYANEFSGEICISKEDYAILFIQGKIESPKNNRQGKSLAIDPSNSDYYKRVISVFSIIYKNLTPETIQLAKTYEYKGQKINESSVLNIEQVQTTNLTVLESRDYFVGE